MDLCAPRAPSDLSLRALSLHPSSPQGSNKNPTLEHNSAFSWLGWGGGPSCEVPTCTFGIHGAEKLPCE